MNHKRKVLSIVLIAVMLLLFPASSTSSANSNIIYESSSKENITSGATLERITRFTGEGWLSINVLRVDLSNPYIQVDVLSNKDNIRTLDSTKSLAQSRGAVAAINGGFFNWLSDAGKGYPDGPVVESGKIITASSEYNRYNDSMATFSINNLNEVIYNYWKTNISLVAPNGTVIPVAQYNKPSTSYNDFTIIDRRWGESSIGAGTSFPDIVEMVVDRGKVSEIRESQPAVNIPQNGYVVVTRQEGGRLISSNFKVGDTVKLDITTNPDWNKLKMAVTGSAVLVRDGKIPATFSMDIPGRHPRTAIGSSKDGKQLIMVTVDGRQKSSIGMTQNELANLMLELGAYNALNLDGGGSTTMVVREPGTSSLEVVNSPSDGMPRAVATALGVFSIAPPSALDGLIIDTADRNIFVNTSRVFTVKGYDRYFNPVAVDENRVQWSVSGIDGSFSGNTFRPKAPGNGKIRASIGGISAEIDICVLDSPVQLLLEEKVLKISENQSKAFTAIKGKDKNGFYALINSDDVTWTASQGIGHFDGSVFTASGQGTGYIQASLGNVNAYCAVSVAPGIVSVKDNFETPNATFLAYPQNVQGNYEITSEQVHSGSYSGKLSYNFTNTEGTRAAYMVYKDGGLTLGTAVSKIGLWVYNTRANTNWLRGEIIDSTGKKHLIDFSRNLDWIGWKYVEASLDNVPNPSKLSRIYLVQVSPVPDSGSIYLDDLSLAATASYPVIDMNQVPRDTVPSDEAAKSVPYQKDPDSFRFSVFGAAKKPSNLLEKLLLMRFTEEINNCLEASAFVGNNSNETAKAVKIPSITTNSGYKSFDISGSRFVQLDTGKGGLRASSPQQWNWFIEQLNSFKGNNIFIFLAESPENFNDNLEADLFQNLLTQHRQKTGQNIWVFYSGNSNESHMEKGVKFLSTAGFDTDSLTPENTDAAKYILVTVKGSNVTYELKPIISSQN